MLPPISVAATITSSATHGVEGATGRRDAGADHDEVAGHGNRDAGLLDQHQERDGEQPEWFHRAG